MATSTCLSIGWDADRVSIGHGPFQLLVTCGTTFGVPLFQQGCLPKSAVLVRLLARWVCACARVLQSLL